MTNHYQLLKAALGRDITVRNVICSVLTAFRARGQYAARRKAAEAGRLWSGIDEEIQAKEITLHLCIRLSKKLIRDCGVPKPTISADVGRIGRWSWRRSAPMLVS